MSEASLLLYAGYGANRDPKMIEAITGQTPKVIGRIVIQDVELCVQRFDQIPTEISDTAPVAVSPKQVMVDGWGENSHFETYTIRSKEAGSVSGTLFELSTEERALIAEWEMIEFGWYKRMRVNVEREDGEKLQAETEGLGHGQDIDRVVDGRDYETYLADPAVMHRVARKAQLEYLERTQQPQS